MTFEDRNWRRPHKTAQQRPKDRLKGSQIAPLSPVEPNRCGNCHHLRLQHDEERNECWGDERECMCSGFVDPGPKLRTVEA